MVVLERWVLYVFMKEIYVIKVIDEYICNISKRFSMLDYSIVRMVLLKKCWDNRIVCNW